MSLQEFLNNDSYSWVMLLRYAIQRNDDTTYEEFYRIVKNNSSALYEIKKQVASKFLRLHFNNLYIEFDSFLALVKWSYHPINADIDSFLNGAVHKQFL